MSTSSPPRSPHSSHQLHDASYLTASGHMHVNKDIVIQKKDGLKRITTAKRMPTIDLTTPSEYEKNALRISHHSIQNCRRCAPPLSSRILSAPPSSPSRERKRERGRARKRESAQASPNKLKQDQSARATTIARVLNKWQQCLTCPRQRSR